MAIRVFKTSVLVVVEDDDVTLEELKDQMWNAVMLQINEDHCSGLQSVAVQWENMVELSPEERIIYYHDKES